LEGCPRAVAGRSELRPLGWMYACQRAKPRRFARGASNASIIVHHTTARSRQRLIPPWDPARGTAWAAPKP